MSSSETEQLAELLARTPRLTVGYGAPYDYRQAAELLIARGVTLSSPGKPEGPWRILHEGELPALVARSDTGQSVGWFDDRREAEAVRDALNRVAGP